MAIYKEREKNIEIIFPINDLDALTGEEVALHIKNISDEIDAVIINCSRINYLNSRGLRELIQILKYLKDRNKKFAITALNNNILKIFKNTNLIRLFDIYDNDSEAKRNLLL